MINPANGKVFATVPSCSEADLNAAVSGAKAAFQTWKKTPYADRAACLNKFADILESRIAEFAEALTKEQGKPLMFATLEINMTLTTIRDLAKDGELKSEIRHEDDKARYELHYVPRGVVGGSK